MPGTGRGMGGECPWSLGRSGRLGTTSTGAGVFESVAEGNRASDNSEGVAGTGTDASVRRGDSSVTGCVVGSEVSSGQSPGSWEAAGGFARRASPGSALQGGGEVGASGSFRAGVESGGISESVREGLASNAPGGAGLDVWGSSGFVAPVRPDAAEVRWLSESATSAAMGPGASDSDVSAATELGLVRAGKRRSPCPAGDVGFIGGCWLATGCRGPASACARLRLETSGGAFPRAVAVGSSDTGRTVSAASSPLRTWLCGPVGEASKVGSRAAFAVDCRPGAPAAAGGSVVGWNG
jgi:hypothetical protein